MRHAAVTGSTNTSDVRTERWSLKSIVGSMKPDGPCVPVRRSTAPRSAGNRVPADDLRVDLGELAVPPFLRFLVSEHVARAVQLEWLRPTAEIGDIEPED